MFSQYQRVNNSVLVGFDAGALKQNINVLQNVKPTEHRKKQEIKSVAGLTNPTYIKIANTKIQFEHSSCDLNLNLSEFLCDVDFKVQKSIVTVFSRKKYNNKPLKLFQLEVEDQLLIDEIKAMISKSKITGVFRHDIIPHLKLSFSSGKLNAEIQYSFSYIESLYMDFSLSVKLHFIPLISHYLSDQEEIEFDSKVFYNSITKNTEILSKDPKKVLVPGLEAELLPFQSQTVNWLLTQEGLSYDATTNIVHPMNLKTLDTQTRLDKVSFGFKLIKLPFYEYPVWFNQYSCNLCSNPKAIDFLESVNQSYAQNLLCEEMGLGKTVEILSLILLNKRKFGGEESTYYNAEFDRNIAKSKTTLIICPDSLISQWVDEIELHSPSLKSMVYKGIQYYKKKTSEELTNKLLNCDIVLTSYSILQREVHNATYDPSKAKRFRASTIESKNTKIIYNSNYFKQDQIAELDGFYTKLGVSQNLDDNSDERYTSPLVLIQFFRLVLDEVQMVSATSSNVYKISSLIPKVHSWGVSGTPIRNDINDLGSLISFLNIHPFSTHASWRQLLNNKNGDIIRLFNSIAFRHTKEMVKADIKLPPQQKILLSIPFGPVEQNNYDELYTSFLHEVKLNTKGEPTVDDWEITPQYQEKMRRWLKILRRVCCHANLVHERGYADLGYTSFGYDTIEKVLESMIDSTRDKIVDLEKNVILHQIDKGLHLELLKELENSLQIWSTQQPILEEKIKKLREVNESNPSEKGTTLLRTYLELLHRVYYFIASAHYQNSTPPITLLVPGIAEQVLEEYGPEDDNYYYYSNHPESIDYSHVVVSRALTEKESKERELEEEFYAKAQIIRQEILSEPMKAVAETLYKAKDIVEFPLVAISHHPIYKKNEINSIQIATFANRVKLVTIQLNLVSDILNNWTSKLVTILSIPLFDSTTDLPSTDDYSNTIDEQAKVSIYFEAIDRLLLQRNTLLNGGEPPKPEAFSHSSNSDLIRQLEGEYPKLDLSNSLRYLLIESKPLLNFEVVDHQILTDLVFTMKDIFEEQTKAKDDFAKYIRLLNDLYNKKIVYFRQLQQLSDNLVVPQFSSRFTHQRDVEHLSILIDKKASEITNCNTRIRYLETLTKGSEMDKECAICRSEIRVGSLVRCGHRYCKDCLKEWLGTSGVKRDCPMCNETINPKEVYDFTLNKEILTANMMENEENNNSDNDIESESENENENEKENPEIFKIYNKLDESMLTSINSIKILYNYGSKINTIIRQIIWLRRKNPDVQILIYSQWTRMLQIISKALMENDIKFLGSQNFSNSAYPEHRTKLRESISSFKKDSSITCFLLNAKVDASGLNLINATHVFICEPLIQTALELQAISRIHRIGQHKQTTVWMFSITGTVEQGIMLLSTRKKLKQKEKLDTEELSKFSKNLIASGVGGEIVDNDDLWNAFFESRINNV